MEKILGGVNQLLRVINRPAVRAKDITPMMLSGNNRSFKIRSQSENFVAKLYFNNQFEPHERLKSEYLFLEHACEIGIHTVPKPLCKIDNLNMALYEFIDGISLKDLPIENHYVEKAAIFFAELNSLSSKVMAKNLPLASDSCLSYKQHINSVSRRLSVLCDLKLEGAVGVEAKVFIRKLAEYWAIYLCELENNLRKLNIDSEKIISCDQLCLSPSDFGFHNAILGKNKEIYFIDFEYAGWDDPAKAIGDFITHPANGITAELSETFLNKVYEYFQDDSLKDRFNLLKPLFIFRWCCIVLNEFIPDRLEKRLFANPGVDIPKIQSDQLEKANFICDKLREVLNNDIH